MSGSPERDQGVDLSVEKIDVEILQHPVACVDKLDQSRALIVFIFVALFCGAAYFVFVVTTQDITNSNNFQTQTSNYGGINTSYEVNSFSDFDILPSSPSRSYTPTVSTSKLPLPSPDSFILLTDLHIDPLYSQYSPISDFCRNELGPPIDQYSPLETNVAHTCVDDFDLHREAEKHYFYGTFGCDTPLETIRSLFEHIHKLKEQPKFIIILGDTCSHCTYSLEHSLSIMDMAGRIFRFYYPEIPIIVALGNNDVYPHNSLPVGPSKMLTGIAEVWRKHNFLPEESLQSFENAGFYSFQVSPSLRILSLNTLYYYTTWCNQNETACSPDRDFEHLEDPANQFQWLRNQLQNARETEQRIYLIGHVGPQCSKSTKKQLWRKEYSDTFSGILDDFVDVVSAIFFSHVHRDTMTLVLRNSTQGIYAPNRPRESLEGSGIYNQQTIIIPPAVSPNTGQNPSYRQVVIDNSNNLLDYRQFYFSLSETQNTEFKEPDWQHQYSFVEEYNVDNLSPTSMFDVFTRLQNNQTLMETYKRFRVTGSNSTKDFNSLSDETLLCVMGGFCNYVVNCINSTGYLSA